MKKKQKNQKLTFNKLTVTKLQNMKSIKGGYTGGDDDVTDKTSNGALCPNAPSPLGDA